jgi:hypothetical protein
MYIDQLNAAKVPEPIGTPPDGTLESGINIAPWINVPVGKFGKKNRRSPICTLYLYYWNRLYEVWNKAVAPGKKSKN